MYGFSELLFRTGWDQLYIECDEGTCESGLCKQAERRLVPLDDLKELLFEGVRLCPHACLVIACKVAFFVNSEELEVLLCLVWEEDDLLVLMLICFLHLHGRY